jgi:hypothetical protein
LAILARIVQWPCGWMTCAAVVVALLLAVPPAQAHGGVSIGIGFGFPVFVGAPIFAPPVYYDAPPAYYGPPYVAYGPPPPLYRHHFHRVRHYRHCCCCY